MVRRDNLLIEISEYKGFIKCPFCQDKAMVRKNAHGQASHRCKCGKYLLFDYDNMTAKPAAPIRGATKFFTDKRIAMVTD